MTTWTEYLDVIDAYFDRVQAVLDGHSPEAAGPGLRVPEQPLPATLRSRVALLAQRQHQLTRDLQARLGTPARARLAYGATDTAEGPSRFL